MMLLNLPKKIYHLYRNRSETEKRDNEDSLVSPQPLSPSQFALISPSKSHSLSLSSSSSFSWIKRIAYEFNKSENQQGGNVDDPRSIGRRSRSFIRYYLCFLFNKKLFAFLIFSIVIFIFDWYLNELTLQRPGYLYFMRPRNYYLTEIVILPRNDLDFQRFDQSSLPPTNGIKIIRKRLEVEYAYVFARLALREVDNSNRQGGNGGGDDILYMDESKSVRVVKFLNKKHKISEVDVEMIRKQNLLQGGKRKGLILVRLNAFGIGNTFHETNDLALPIYIWRLKMFPRDYKMDVGFYDMKSFKNGIKKSNAVVSALIPAIGSDPFVSFDVWNQLGPRLRFVGNYDKILFVDNEEKFGASLGDIFLEEQHMPFYHFDKPIPEDIKLQIQDFAKQVRNYYLNSDKSNDKHGSQDQNEKKSQNSNVNKPKQVLVIYRSSSRFSFGHKSREWLNLNELRQRFDNQFIVDNQGMAWNIVFSDFAKISFKEALQLVDQSSVIMGMHGAGLVHFLYIRPKSVCVQVLTWRMEYDQPSYNKFDPVKNNFDENLEFWGRYLYKAVCESVNGKYMEWPCKEFSWTSYPDNIYDVIGKSKEEIMNKSIPYDWYRPGPNGKRWAYSPMFDASLIQPISDFEQMLKESVQYYNENKEKKSN